jgi:integrase/recombinase XerD
MMFNKKISDLKAEEQISTAEKYETAFRVIKKFVKESTKGDQVLFGEINHEWLKRFKKWYLGKGRSLAALAFHLRALRHIFNMAIAAKIITREQYPFGSELFVIPAVRRPLKRYLTVEEKNTLLSHSCETDYQAAALDYWAFSYYCNGMNFADISNLRRRDIFDDHILIDRSKTSNTDSVKKKIVIVLRKEALEIIARRGNRALAPSSYVFPILEDGMNSEERFKVIRAFVLRTNKALKQIADSLGFSNLTTYTARHTFANVILQSGGSTEFIQDSLGHSEKRTTENYLSGFNMNIKKKYAEML